LLAKRCRQTVHGQMAINNTFEGGRKPQPALLTVSAVAF